MTLKGFWKKVLEYLVTTVLVLWLGVVFAFITKMILAPFAPIVTIILVICATVMSLDGWIRGALTISGLLLYIASWVVYYKCNDALLAATVCAVGMLLWFCGVFFRILFLEHPKTA